MQPEPCLYYVEYLGPLTRHVWRWTSDASGNADADPVSIAGALDRLVTQPSKAAAPSDNYDVTLVTDEGEDVLRGRGANRDTATSEAAYLYAATSSGDAVRTQVNGLYRLTIRNAGDTKSGLAALYVIDS